MNHIRFPSNGQERALHNLPQALPRTLGICGMCVDALVARVRGTKREQMAGYARQRGRCQPSVHQKHRDHLRSIIVKIKPSSSLFSNILTPPRPDRTQCDAWAELVREGGVD
jgi:hypothetical protein